MWIIVLLFALIAFYLFLTFPSVRKHEHRPNGQKIFVAHRGLHSISDGIPENSMPAFSNALAHGYSIEIDIHLTSDGKVVIFHDDNLERACGIDKIIENTPYSELSQLSLFGTKCRIPLLEDLLNLVQGKVPLLIEFKCVHNNYKQLCVAANRILQNYTGKYMVQSFNPLALHWYKKNMKSIYRGQLSKNFSRGTSNDFISSLLGSLLLNFLSRPDFISYNIKHTSFLPRRICIGLGAASAGWTFKSKQDLEKYEQKYDIIIFENFLP